MGVVETAPILRCGHCKTEKPADEFPPSQRQSGSWCRQCYREDMRRKLGLTAREHTVACGWCGTEFETTYTKALYCSRACKGRARHRDRQAAINAAKPDRVCAYCGVPLPKSKRADAKFCAADCNMRAHRQTRNFHRRRGLKRTTLVNLRSIAARSGYRCGICGGGVNMTRRHPDPLAPSVDHIVPLAQGGDHADGNLQLAHLRCNLSRRDVLLDA